jgi:hypothetical protein
MAIRGKGLLQNHYIRTNFAALLHHRLMLAYRRQVPIEKNQGSSLHTVLFHPVTAHADPTSAQARLNATHSPICVFEEKIYLASWTKLWLTLDEL